MAVLKRELGFWDAVATGVASMVGAGIFVVSGIGAGLAGPSVILAFVLAGALALFSALSSAELAAAIPREGGAYEYAGRLISKDLGFYTGWLFVSSKVFESAAVALAFGAYASLFTGLDGRAGAAAAIIAFTAVNASGIRSSTNASKAMAVIKIGVLALFAFVGLQAIQPANYAPFFSSSGLTGLLQATAVVFFAYTGYARIATLGEEIREPRKTIPRAIFVSLAIAASTYVLVTTAAIGLIGAKAFSESPSPIASAAAALGSPALVALVGIAALVATLSVLLGDILASSRTAFAMARNRDLPAFLSKLDSNSNPGISVYFAGALALGLVLSISFVEIAVLTSLTILLYYGVTNASALKLSKANRLYPRFIAVAGLLGCIGLALTLAIQSWLWTLGLLAAGFAYRSITRKN